MTNNEIVAKYLCFLAENWNPSPKFQKGHPELMTPEALHLGRNMLRAAADQIGRGLHTQWQALQNEED